MTRLNALQNWFESSFGLSSDVQQHLLVSLMLVVFLTLLRWLVVWIAFRRTEDARARYRIRKTTTYLSVLLGLIFVGRVWIPALQDLSTFLGLVSAGLAIALKDVITSVVGWAYLLWERPFEVGDRIQIGDHAGDVVDQRVFRFTLMEIGNWVDSDQSTGRMVHIPNNRVFTDVIANYTGGFKYIWNELEVLVTFESNWEKAKEILQQAADKHSLHSSSGAMEAVRKAARKAMIVYTTLTPRVWTKIADSGVSLTIRYFCDPRQRRGTAELIWEEILREFRKCEDIGLAYPTVRRYINTEEGKSGTGGPLETSGGGGGGPDEPTLVE